MNGLMNVQVGYGSGAINTTMCLLPYMTAPEYGRFPICPLEIFSLPYMIFFHMLPASHFLCHISPGHTKAHSLKKIGELSLQLIKSFIT